MDKKIFGKKSISFIMAMAFAVSGCMSSDVPSTGASYSSAPGGLSGARGNNAGSDSTTTTATAIPPKVEIRHLIEPNLSTDTSYSSGTGYTGGGSYVRKLTLPKNYAGRLYLAGINISTLASRIVKVRFKFGTTREAITVPATVTQAPGITPQSTIQVLVMDLRSQPFRNIRLPYDLFDYNEYNFAGGDSPVQDNRDSGLYCRGLRVEDDPTFLGVGACDGLQSNPSQPAEECLYAYAKVMDQGLVKETQNSLGQTVWVPTTPTYAQVKSITGSSYYQDYFAQQLMKPLLDSPQVPYKFSELAVPANATDSQNVNFLNVGTEWNFATINGTKYYYRGPYRLVDKSNWQFKFTGLDGEKRLFKSGSWLSYPYATAGVLPDDSQASPSQDKIYFNSYLFPLATKLDLGANVPHLSSATVDGTRSENILAASGKTLWMDGANARAQSKNSDLEHIGSCNVTATMEIIAKDKNNNEYVVASSNDVKLQLVRPTQYFTDTGNDVLYSNFKTCNSNASCGGNECCFNNRCWDQTLVSQCYDSSSTQGNRQIGDSCSTDLECSSLCCNRTSGLCSPHNTLLSPAVLCSKPTGDFCIAKEWCQKSPIVTCLIVKTGTDPQGNVTCRQQCYTTNEYGDCKNGVCTPPVQAPIPVFDPSQPNACANAVPAPSF